MVDSPQTQGDSLPGRLEDLHSSTSLCYQDKLVYTCDPSTREVGGRKTRILKSSSATQQIEGKPGIHKTISKIEKQNKIRKLSKLWI